MKVRSFLSVATLLLFTALLQDSVDAYGGGLPSSKATTKPPRLEEREVCIKHLGIKYFVFDKR